MDPKLKQILDMPFEEMEALSPDELVAHMEELYQLALKNNKGIPPQMLAQVREAKDQYKKSLANEKAAHRRVKIGEQNQAILRARLNHLADAALENMPNDQKGN